METQVDILLATYQGERYVREQIESILNQTYPHFHLWIRDDGSTDQTLSIVKQIALQHPIKISVCADTTNLGVKGNFNALMSMSKAPYILFADQDDIWLPHKLEHSLNTIKELEKQHETHTPILVHTDLQVVDSDLKLICTSLWKYAGLDPRAMSINRLLTQNNLTGCTFIFNRNLLKLASPIPTEAIMHDWWLGLVASQFGHIGFIPSATVLYRQHASNDTGAKPYSLASFIQKQPTKCLSKTCLQAATFMKRYSSHLLSHETLRLAAFASLEHLSYLRQKQQILAFKFFKNGFLRNLRWLLG